MAPTDPARNPGATAVLSAPTKRTAHIPGSADPRGPWHGRTRLYRNPRPIRMSTLGELLRMAPHVSPFGTPPEEGPLLLHRATLSRGLGSFGRGMAHASGEPRSALAPSGASPVDRAGPPLTWPDRAGRSGPGRTVAGERGCGRPARTARPCHVQAERGLRRAITPAPDSRGVPHRRAVAGDLGRSERRRGRARRGRRDRGEGGVPGLEEQPPAQQRRRRADRHARRRPADHQLPPGRTARTSSRSTTTRSASRARRTG